MSGFVEFTCSKAFITARREVMRCSQ